MFSPFRDVLVTLGCHTSIETSWSALSLARSDRPRRRAHVQHVRAADNHSVRRKPMSLVPRDPFDALTPLREAMNRLFEDSFFGPRFDILTGRAFPVDLYETEDGKQYVIEA